MSGIEPEIFKTDGKQQCYDKKKCADSCGYCFVNAKKSMYSRKCFMTGEYCSKQTSIQRERKELHDKDEINAFVIMSFSDMSDVVYEWRIKRFIEKLKMYLAFDENRNRICCSKQKLEEENDKSTITYHRVKEIQVERGDTDVASNYVMCSRICQRIQIADLVIVDVSHQNPNVFYELGMAVALGKLILPICFSESYYKMSVPKVVKETDNAYKMVEHHIGSYPWRKELFEKYGIFQIQSPKPFDADNNGSENDKTRKTYYMDYAHATKIDYGFSDIQYSRFPYDEVINIEQQDDRGAINGIGTEKIGEKLYNELKDSYNKATKANNTLLVYTMDGFLNRDEAGTCIVNFYHTIIAKIQEEQCFCGDRVGVLVQGNGIPEEDKDSDKQIDLFYSIGEIIHIGVNQATYRVEEKKLKTRDVVDSRNFAKYKRVTEKQGNGILRELKGYMRNRSIIIYPKNPVYVKREIDKLIYKEEEQILQEKNVIKKSNLCYCSSNQISCLYHKMLHLLRYVNEVVIDISNNSIQALFWLGIAHGSSVNAITVSHDATEKEREKMIGSKGKKTRSVFDVAGLWTAILHSNDTKRFYQQLEQAQYGIASHEKLVLNAKNVHEKKLHDTWTTLGEEFIDEDIVKIYKDEKNEITRKLESYYRSRFWNAMLRHNQLLICMSQIEYSDNEEKEPRGYTSKWDFKASSLLSHYLSKRTVISEYRVEAITGDKPVDDIGQMNFISLGSDAKPLGIPLSKYISNHSKCNQVIHVHDIKPFKCVECGEEENLRIYKGFIEAKKEEKKELGLYTQHPHFECVKKCCAKKSSTVKNGIVSKVSKLEEYDCSLCGRMKHKEIAQLIIWRESSYNPHEKTVFRVAVNGSSGPATLALSGILVGDDQKMRLFQTKRTSKYDENLLYNLQYEIRKKLMDEYRSRLCSEIEKILKREQNRKGEKKIQYSAEQRNRYEELIWYAVSIYLYNELYRYFLPLLSDKDIYSLCNGMYNFVNHMRMEKESPFDVNYPENGDSQFLTAIVKYDVVDIIDVIPKILSSVLKELVGVEVFYEVIVRHNPSKKDVKEREDTREVVDIKMRRGDDNVNCLWLNN